MPHRSHHGPRPAASVAALLTPREREVATHLADDTSPADIGKILGIKADTARAHIKSIQQKLGVRSRHAAVLPLHHAGIRVTQLGNGHP